MQNLKYIGAMIIEFCFFNQIKKKKNMKNKNKKNMDNLWKTLLRILHRYFINYIKILIGVNFCGNPHFHASQMKN